MKTILKLALLGASAAGAAAFARTAARASYSYEGQSVLITGGSRGLGLILARLLAAEGARLTLVGRHREPLEAAEQELIRMGGVARILVCDIRERRHAKEAIESAAGFYGSIDVLINNAGVIQVGPIEHMRIEDFQNAMDTHAWAPLYTTLAALPLMRRQGGGRIVNISSIGGKIAVPHMLPYTMSKFALSGLSEGMRHELARYGIHVTSVYPGLMRTGSHVNAHFKGHHDSEFTWFSLMSGLPLFSIDAGRAARQIVEACRRGRPELVITPQARLAIIVNALFPNLTARAMAAMNAALPRPVTGFDPGSRLGWDSRAGLSRSVLTRLADRAIGENNEQRAA